MGSLENQVIVPVYSQIALDIALRISKGELKENTKIFGRSVMASEYGVSPETIRRAIRLLEDVGILETRQNSGSLIISSAKAKDYVDKFSQRNDIRAYKKKLSELLEEQETLNRRIYEVADAIIRINDKFSAVFPFPVFETPITEASPLIGHSLGELNFWQQTMATVIAIRRKEQIILSPGPYAVLLAGDAIIFVGDINCVDSVNRLVNNT